MSVLFVAAFLAPRIVQSIWKVRDLGWVSPKADPEVSIHMKLVYWEVFPGNQEGTREMGLGRKEDQTGIGH